MDQNTLLIIIAVFVAVAAIALVAGAGMMFGIYKSARHTEEHVKRVAPKIEAIVPKVEALVVSSTETVNMSRTQIHEITTKTSEILDITRRQMARIDEVLEDASVRARVQFDRAELVLDDTMTRAQETIAIVHGGIMRPLREIQGVAAGLRTAINHLMRGGRPNPTEATADEEMFI